MATNGKITNSPSYTRSYPVATTAAIQRGDMLKISRQTVGGVSNVMCVTPCTSGDKPVGVAMDDCAAPSSHGAAEVIVEICKEARFAYPPASGTVDRSYVGKTCDVGGDQTIDITASTDDVIYIDDVDENNNMVIVRIDFDDVYVGVA